MMTDPQDLRTPATVPSGRGLTWYLTGLVLVALLPTIGAAILAVFLAGRAFEDAQSGRLLETANTLARAAESELERGIALLNVLSVVPTHPAASLIADPWAAAAERRIGGRLIEEIFVSGRVPEGDGLSPRGVPLETLRRAVETTRPAVSNLFVDPSTRELRIAVAAAISHNDEETRLIAVVVPPERLVQVLKRSRPTSDDLIMAIVDGTGRFVARSVDPEQHIGEQAPGWADRMATARESGTFTTMAADGRQAIFGFKTIANSAGWVLVVGEPLSAFRARATGPLLGLVAAAALAVIVALLAASRLGRTILRPVTAIAARARLIAAGAERPPTAAEYSHIAEFEALRLSLESSEKALRARAVAEAEAARSLADAERRQHLLATTGTLVFWRVNSDGQATSTGWSELTGLDARLDGDWFANIHADDMRRVKSLWRKAYETGSPYDAEYRIRVADGSWRWVRARATRAAAANGEGYEWIGLTEDIDAYRAAQTRMEHMASHDALTGLANRASFNERLANLCGEGRGGEVAILCLGLDRFKALNDALGRAIGDEMLKQVAARLAGVISPEDMVARLGGDEFAIVQTAGPQPRAASLLAQEVMAALEAPFVVGSDTIVVTASVGIALAGGDPAELAMQKADMALDRAKGDGRARICFFESALDARMQERHRLEQDLRRAVAEGQFLLHYQPVVAVTSRRLVGFEALVRWRHPERGMVSPNEFIPMAEEIGLIVPIGRWVLERACADAAAWGHDLKVAVNVSPKQLADPDFPAVVQASLDGAGLPARRLELEITENALMADIDGAMSMMMRLKTVGCAIAMDDFGTGYSSLGYLRTFPFDKVKIDRSFLQDFASARESSAIVRAVTSLCGSLRITSTAEGVETEEQLALLKAEGCDEAQGYLFGRPTPLEDMAAVFERFGILGAASAAVADAAA
ncbi:EAL domain-containing protein [Phreatobacter sp.]|uniref:bifunctional diguanylate cyclase/phosphodiesterase n=1 Tax=Phreatobacter sp. TaxID=1966341 RepID=UPI0022BDEA88|nr:EAL domain-containing protein [Phreatobacter sp.]MCZ8314177.1 EAL domain-containing protein [Phreatobacter sp.]